MTRAPRTWPVAGGPFRLPLRLVMAGVAAGLLAPSAGAAQQPVTITTSAYLGLSFNEQEERLPASPLVGGSATLDLWQVSVGGDLWLNGVDALQADSTTAFHLNYYVAGRVGVKLAHPRVYPVVRLFGLAGLAFPARDLVWNRDLKAWEGGSSVIVGGGANVSVGPIMAEARFIQDRRFSTGGTSVTVAIGWTRGWLLDGLRRDAPHGRPDRP